MKKILIYYPPLISALLLIFSFPRWDQGYLGWFALLPLFFFCQTKGISYWHYFKGGILCGFVFFSVLYAYMVFSFDFFFPRYFGILIVITAALYSSLFFGFFSLGVSFFLRQKSFLVLAVGGSSLWVVLEYLRSLGLLGHTGGYLGYSQSYYPFLLETTAVYGYWGLSFIMVLFQVILFIILTTAWENKTSNTRGGRVLTPAKREVLLSTFILLLLFGAGTILPSFFTVEKRDEPLNIALVQGNIPQERILDKDFAVDNFQRYLDLSKEAYREYSALDLIVWPETVLSTTVASLFPQPKEYISELSGETGADLLFGSMYKEEGTEQTYNSILMQKAGKDELEDTRYDKIQLVPFAEYFPSPDILERLFNLQVDLGMYEPGKEVPLFNLDNMPFGGIICFESYFHQPALEIVRKGGKHIFVLTNNAWFLDSNGLEQHAQAAAVRATELGTGVTQVANTGYTISYNYRGEEILSMPTHEKGITLLETSFPERNTLYRQLGNYFLYLSSGLLLFSIIYTFKRL